MTEIPVVFIVNKEASFHLREGIFRVSIPYVKVKSGHGRYHFRVLARFMYVSDSM